MQDRLIIKPMLLRASTMEDTLKWMTHQTGNEGVRRSYCCQMMMIRGAKMENV
jgi:hypothetical protein